MAIGIESGSRVLQDQGVIPANKKGLRDRLQEVRKMPTRLFKRMYYPGMMHRMGGLFLWDGINVDLVNEKAKENPLRERDNIDLLEPHLEAGKKLVIIFSHQGLGDILLTVPVANAVATRFPKHIKVVRYILSKTIGNGKQGEMTSSAYEEAAKRQFRRNHMRELEIVSTNDVNVRREASNRTDAVKIMNAAKEYGSAIALHNEATMFPGRRREDDPSKINGMVHTNEDFRPILERWIKEGVRMGPRKSNADVVFLLVALHGSYKLWSPNLRDQNAVPQKTEGITPEARKIIARTELFNAYGFPAPDFPLGIVRVSKPITSEYLRQFEDPVGELELINARQAPNVAQGVFRDLV